MEFRAADAAAHVQDAVLQAALSRALVHTAYQDPCDGGESRPVRDDVSAAAVWAASRYVLHGRAVDPWRECGAPATAVLDALVEHVTPALEERGELMLVHDLVARKVGRRSGERGQLAANNA